MNQKQHGGDKSQNIQAGRDVNYNLAAGADKRDFGIIDEIFKSVIQQLQTRDNRPNGKYVNLNKKIKINFRSKEDRERVQQNFKYAYTKVPLFEKRIQEEDPEIQNDLHGHVFNRYNALKDRGLSNIEILEELFKQFIIPGKEDNAQYCNLARAFVLFFFDDCTIFEKTDTEK